MKTTKLLVVSIFMVCSSQLVSAQDVIYVPTDHPIVTAMLELADVTEADTVYDLGCGDGRIVISAARDFGARGKGIDIDPARIAEARQNAVQADVEDMVEFELGDLFEADVSEASVVALYLLSSLNMKLRPILLEQLKPGSRIVSHSFDMGDWEPDETRVIDGTSIYLWTVPEKP